MTINNGHDFKGKQERFVKEIERCSRSKLKTVLSSWHYLVIVVKDLNCVYSTNSQKHDLMLEVFIREPINLKIICCSSGNLLSLLSALLGRRFAFLLDLHLFSVFLISGSQELVRRINFRFLEEHA